MHHHTDIARHSAIELAWSCRDTCQSTLYNYCLEHGHTAPDHVRIMADCIQICQTAADFMTRNSAFHAAACRACAEICDACANSCETMDDAAMKACVDVCRACAESCRAMSGGMRAAG